MDAHAFPLPTPIAEMGEHPRPSWAVTPLRSIPRRERSAEPAAEFDCSRSLSAQVLCRKGRMKWTYALHAVAALDGPGAAAASVGGGRKVGEGEGGDDGETGEHGVGLCGW